MLASCQKTEHSVCVCECMCFHLCCLLCEAISKVIRLSQKTETKIKSGRPLTYTSTYSIYLSVYISINWHPVCLSIHLSVCLSVCLLVYPSVDVCPCFHLLTPVCMCVFTSRKQSYVYHIPGFFLCKVLSHQQLSFLATVASRSFL